MHSDAFRIWSLDTLIFQGIQIQIQIRTHIQVCGYRLSDRLSASTLAKSSRTFSIASDTMSPVNKCSFTACWVMNSQWFGIKEAILRFKQIALLANFWCSLFLWTLAWISIASTASLGQLVKELLLEIFKFKPLVKALQSMEGIVVDNLYDTAVSYQLDRKACEAAFR